MTRLSRALTSSARTPAFFIEVKGPTDCCIRTWGDKAACDYVNELALSADAKRDRLREIKAKIVELEREEEALIEKTTDEGFDIMRRHDASPAIILGIVVNKKARVAEGMLTTWALF